MAIPCPYPYPHPYPYPYPYPCPYSWSYPDLRPRASPGQSQGDMLACVNLLLHVDSHLSLTHLSPIPHPRVLLHAECHLSKTLNFKLLLHAGCHLFKTLNFELLLHAGCHLPQAGRPHCSLPGAHPLQDLPHRPLHLRVQVTGCCACTHTRAPNTPPTADRLDAAACKDA